MNELHWMYRLQEKVFSRHRAISYAIFILLMVSGLLRNPGLAATASFSIPLAQLSGVLGGLILLAYLLSKQDRRVHRDLISISLLLMIATVSFSLSALHSINAFTGNFNDSGAVIARVFFSIGGLSFSVAISYLILLIGRLYEADAPSSPPETSPVESE